MNYNYKNLKLGCYMSNFSMSAVSVLSPLLFVTFHDLYGISYSLLGLLVLINFSTQLLIDLLFSFFSEKFNIPKTTRIMPILVIAGFSVYALTPFVFPQYVYAGLVAGTVLFAVSSGLNEVLITPIVGQIPSDNPDRETSKLHSVYAWGTVAVVCFSTLFLRIAGRNAWQFLPLILSVIPLSSAIFYFRTAIPALKSESQESTSTHLLKTPLVWLSVLSIFFGGATECTLAQWASGYLEVAFKIDKVWGDILGVAMYGVMLGLGRTLYGKYGKNVENVLVLCAIGSLICYVVTIFSPFPVLSLLSCALTGFASSMLWPGNIIMTSERFPKGGVVIFALMASGGDLGASVGPQIVGSVTELAAKNSWIVDFGASLGLGADQIAMRTGLLAVLIFPILTVVMAFLFKRIKQKECAAKLL